MGLGFEMRRSTSGYAKNKRRIRADDFPECIQSIKTIAKGNKSQVVNSLKSVFPEGVSSAGIVIAASIVNLGYAKYVDIKYLVEEIEGNLADAYNRGPSCPVCAKKKIVCTAENVERLKKIGKLRTSRTSLIAVTVLNAIKEMSDSFTLKDFSSVHPDLKIATVRALVTRLRKQGEFVVNHCVWEKTENFGKSTMWHLLKDPRSNVLKIDMS